MLQRLLPPDSQTRPSNWERIRFLLVVLIPWVALYKFTVSLRLPGTAFQFQFEDRLPIYPWTALVYQSIYVMVVLAPWCARTQRDLRELTISAWAAMALVFPFYWMVPSSAPRRPLTGDSWIARVLILERNTYPPTAAFPSFHVLWAVFLAKLYRPTWAGIAYAAAITVSCVSTGMHYIPDLLASLAIAPFLLKPGQAWASVRRVAERTAAWRDKTATPDTISLKMPNRWSGF